ncbi:uncharacterized protein Pyn_34165 [Prunus yedoensis var. nudiflora]|uniref:Uncharacterized protein n=1 Tax=Prunus yedoensis var. nudiflora TaxID=2094558 RepID=A0A314ZFR4_PRUYE|nr:uncharacterized protein Pyn_34165 [Prunus yedoensis var. nudiflora]
MAADCLCLNKGLPLPLLLLWDRASVYVQKLRCYKKNEVGFRIWTSKEFHQYQVVGRKLPTASDEHPKIYRMKLWATNEVRAKSKFWKLKKVKKSNGQVLALNESMLFCVGKWFLLNSPPGEIQFVAKDVKEAASKAPPRNDRSNWRLFRFDEFWALTSTSAKLRTFLLYWGSNFPKSVLPKMLTVYKRVKKRL